MELLLKTFSLSQEEFELHNKKSTEHVRDYFNKSIDKNFIHLFTYLDDLDGNLPEYCEFGADKCRITNFQEFCNNLNIDINKNLQLIIKKYERMGNVNYYHFYNRDKTFMFTCTSPLYMEGSLAYFGCTGSLNHVVKAFEMIYNDGNYDLCYGARDYA